MYTLILLIQLVETVVDFRDIMERMRSIMLIIAMHIGRSVSAVNAAIDSSMINQAVIDTRLRQPVV